MMSVQTSKILPAKGILMSKGEEVRTFRERMGWSQHTLANELGVDIGTVSQWERGVEPLSSTWKLFRNLQLGNSS